jgi:outer membrane protein
MDHLAGDTANGPLKSRRNATKERFSTTIDMMEGTIWHRIRNMLLLIVLLDIIGEARAQNISSSPAEPWINQKRQAQFDRSRQASQGAPYTIDPEHAYTLPESINLAELHNPDTRVAWQNAKAKLEEVGIAESALYPSVAAVAIASTWRDGALIGTGFHRQTIGLFQPTLNLNYLIFDFGKRSGAIAETKDDLFAADFAFNDVHRRLIYRTSSSYYYFLNALGQLDAARATLANAQTVQKDAEARLKNGVATLPDVLEARAAAAQAEYDLQAADGAREIALGNLSTSLGLPPETALQVQPLDQLSVPDELPASVEEVINRALRQRPDLLEQVAKVRAADASLEQDRSAYFPSLSFSGLGGLQRAYGQQDLLPGTYAGGETWNVSLTLQWNLFDGLRREHAFAEAKAHKAQAKAEIDATEDEISNEVWSAYSSLKTAERQRKAAAALLLSAEQSYAAALKSYDLGLRNLLDVVAAQRTLAQARSADVAVRAQVLTQFSNLAFRSGDLLRAAPEKAGQQP